MLEYVFMPMKMTHRRERTAQEGIKSLGGYKVPVAEAKWTDQPLMAW
jgi:hypothetical protein